MRITAHTLVKNEERYLWFSVTSVIDYMDKVLLWDTGSTDNTVGIIKKLKKAYPKKIDFKEVGEVDVDEFTNIRQEMLEKSDCDWVFILDGDEVWWEDSIKGVVSIIEKEGEVLESIVTPYINLVGDIYHYQGEEAGRYKIDNQVGHLTIRAMRQNISGLHLERPHGTQGFFDGQGSLIQERDSKKRLHTDFKYLHFTHLLRSGDIKNKADVPKRQKKYKYELGHEFPLDFYYPESFFKDKPDIVPSPWTTLDDYYKRRAFIETPLKKIKRRLLNGRTGY